MTAADEQPRRAEREPRQRPPSAIITPPIAGCAPTINSNRSQHPHDHLEAVMAPVSALDPGEIVPMASPSPHNKATKCYQVLPSATKCYQVLPRATTCYQDLTTASPGQTATDSPTEEEATNQHPRHGHTRGISLATTACTHMAVMMGSLWQICSMARPTVFSATAQQRLLDQVDRGEVANVVTGGDPARPRPMR
jgi:hypothetical protein